MHVFDCFNHFGEKKRDNIQSNNYIKNLRRLCQNLGYFAKLSTKYHMIQGIIFGPAVKSTMTSLWRVTQIF